MNIDNPEFMEYFLDFSALATGFGRHDLVSTHQSALYFSVTRGVIGDSFFGDFMQTFHRVGLEQLLASEKYGPIARNIVKLWYLATWERLPTEWLASYLPTLDNVAFIPSPDSYIEGLLWASIGTNPPGAKGPGYATWSSPPSVKLN